LNAPEAERSAAHSVDAVPAIKIEVQGRPTELLRELSAASRTFLGETTSSDDECTTAATSPDDVDSEALGSPGESVGSESSDSASPEFAEVDNPEFDVDVSSLWFSDGSVLDENLENTMALCSSWEPEC